MKPLPKIKETPTHVLLDRALVREQSEACYTAVTAHVIVIIVLGLLMIPVLLCSRYILANILVAGIAFFVISGIRKFYQANRLATLLKSADIIEGGVNLKCGMENEELGMIAKKRRGGSDA